MAAPKKNKYWQLRNKHGRDHAIDTAETLWESCVEYFQWCEDNPLYEEKGFAFQGVVTRESFPKMRAMTLTGLHLWLEITENTWQNYKERGEDFLRVIKQAENIIYTQKFEGAAADMLNSNIIARDLGLSDKSKIDHTSSDGTMSPPKTIDELYDENRNAESES